MADPAAFREDPDRFMEVFQEVVADHDMAVAEWVDNGAKLRHVSGKEMTLFFGNLYRECMSGEEEEWPSLIARFLQHMFEIEDTTQTLAEASDQVRPRVGKPFRMDGGQPAPWSMPLDGTDLVLNLVIDYPERMQYVNTEMVDETGRTAAEWLDLALDNLQQRTPSDWYEVIDEETDIRVAQVGDSYDASRSLLLDELLPETIEQGCFVLPLGRDRLFFMPVQIDSLPHVHLLKLLADKNYDRTPYAITNEIYWVCQRKWTRFPIEIDGDSVRVYPPIEMARALGWIEDVSEDVSEDGAAETDEEF